MFPSRGPFGGRDPFDAFFGPSGNPFNMMQSMMQQMNSVFNDPFFADPFAHGYPPQFPYPQQQPQQQQLPPTSVPRIEEIPHEHHQHHRRHQQSEPVVEEPEDVEGSHTPAHTSGASFPDAARGEGAAEAASALGPFMGGQQLQHGISGNPVFSSFSSYSYSSSSYSHGGAGGSYSTTTTTRIRPDGTRETQRTVRDGRSVEETVTVRRGGGDQVHVVKRTRDGRGREVAEEEVVVPEDADALENEWERRMRYALPRSSPGGGSGVAALPSYPHQEQQQYLRGGGVQQQQQQYQGGGGAGAPQQYPRQHPGAQGQGCGAAGEAGWGGRYV